MINIANVILTPMTNDPAVAGALMEAATETAESQTATAAA